MTRGRASIVAAVAVLVVLATSPTQASAQEESIPISGATTDDYPNVIIEFSPPTDLSDGELQPEEITLTENGEERASTLRQTTAENIHVVLAVDTSGSMVGAPIEQAKLAARAFVERLPSDSQVALIGFGNEPVVLNEFTSDREAVLAAIDAIEVDASAETSLYDATRLAVQQFAPSTPGPRYVIVVTDGGDTISEASLGTAQAAVQAARVPVFAVSLVTFESDPLALAALTSATGGGVFESTDPTALADLTAQIANAITTQYEISYISEAHGRTTVEIRIDRGDKVAVGQIGVDLPLLIDAAPIATVAPTAEPTATVAPEPQPESVATVVVGRRIQTWQRPVGIALVGLALVVLFNFLLWPTRRRRQNPLRNIAPVVGATPRDSEGVLTRGSQALLRVAERLVARRDEEGLLARRLDRAGIRMRPAEYLVMVGLIGVVGALLGLLVNFALSMFLVLVVTVGAWLILGIRGDRRGAQFEDQLPNTLRMMSGALRGGFSLSQVVDLVATESSSPTRDEFSRLNVEEALGRDTADSFRDVAKRMQSDDFMWVAEAVEINRSVGGNLSEVLENVSETIRTRQRIKGQIQTLSAEGRMSAKILLALPFLVFLLESILNPEFSSELTGSSGGRMAIVVGLVMMGIASIWMKRIVRLKY